MKALGIDVVRLSPQSRNMEKVVSAFRAVIDSTQTPQQVLAALEGQTQRSVLTVSTMLDGEFGLHDVCLSVPSIVSESGVVKIIESQLPEHELAALTASASILKKAVEELDLAA